MEDGTIRYVRTGDLSFDPRRLQYKLCFGKAGSTGSLSGVESWNEILAGIILVWRDPQCQKTFVVNGHNRALKARQLSVPWLLVRYLQVGTAAEARAMGAIANIGENQGTALDAAKYFRDTGENISQLKALGLNPNSKLVKNGYALSGLHKTLFDMAVAGDLPLEQGAILGELDLKSQIEVWNLCKGRKRITNELIRELATVVNNAPTHTELLFDLFGKGEEERSLAMTKLELTAKVRASLLKDKRLYSLAVRGDNANRLESVGNQIAIRETAKARDSASLILEVFDRLKGQTSPISEVLNSGAMMIAQGEKMANTTKLVVNRLVELIPSLV